ncbi:hypothetical protein BD560DRAFT_488687 [Blakeslea trispora]|nr:hypothetical protein BD560DRAFT_488687 [Blakeslea trispora]
MKEEKFEKPKSMTEATRRQVHDALEIFFSELNALKDCRLDFAVQVHVAKKIACSIGEVKGAKFSPKNISIDTYRLGIFGLNMLWKYQLKRSLVFQVQGICLMIEVERLLLNLLK